MTIPKGVTSIGVHAFDGCDSLTGITIPQSVTDINREAFKACARIRWIRSPLMITPQEAPGCSFALLLSGENRAWLAYASKAGHDNLSDFAKPGSWDRYDLELVNGGPAYKYKLSARIIGALGRLTDPVELTEENRALLAELVVKNAKKLVPLAEEMGEGKMIEALFSLNNLDSKTAKAVKKLLAASSVPEIAALAGLESKAEPPAPAKAITPQSPLQTEYAAKLKAIKGDTVIRKMKLVGRTLPVVKLADGAEAPEELFRFLLASYGGQIGDAYHFVPEADEAAKLLAYDSLCDALDAVSGHLDGPSYPAILPLLCRYGSAKQIRSLTNAWKEWGRTGGGQKGRRAQAVFSEALVLSDTREAVVWLEKNATLEKYAALRGVSKAEIYEKYLFDFGFDESGRRVFDLGTAKIEVTLTRELGLALRNTTTGKAVRSIPRKGVDPAARKKADNELADMRQTLKKAAKIKLDQLFKEYLDAVECPAERWKQSYLQNPFLRAIASLLVWSQGGRSFILSASGPVDSAGQPYAVTDEPVLLAHPMEMHAEEVTAWQRYFTSRSLKQPFPQIWEPVYAERDIREDRYKECRINPLYLRNQERRGISAEWYGREYSKHNVTIQNFHVEARDAQRRDDDVRQYLEIVSLRPEIWNRRANMVIAFLDRITVWDRVKKDDASVMNQMERFTLAQITEFIKAAQEADAVNVLAALLDYKNARFADFDPMDEFTLEW